MHILNGGNVTGYSETSSLSFSCVYAGFPWLPEFHMGNMKGLVTNFVYRGVVSLRSRRLGGGIGGKVWTSTQAAVAAAGVVIVDV